MKYKLIFDISVLAIQTKNNTVLKYGMQNPVIQCLSFINQVVQRVILNLVMVVQLLPNLEITGEENEQKNKLRRKEDILASLKDANTDKGLQPTWKVPNSLSTAAFETLLKHWGF